MAKPKTESGNGSLSTLRVSITAVSSCDSKESFCAFDAVRPMDDGFLRRTFDLGLSTVDAEDPETREGVLAKGGSNLPAREDADGSIDLDCRLSDAVIPVPAVGCFRTSLLADALGIPPFCFCAPREGAALSVLCPGRFFVSLEGEWCMGTFAGD